MPQGDEKHRLIYEELVNILGNEYVEDDLAVLEAFSRESQTPSFISKARAEFIVLPHSTEDVKNILKLANRYQFPCSVTSTGLQLFSCCAIEGYPYWCLLDLKRMNHFSIDEKNMYAVVEPYVSVAQVQAEAMKMGLFTPVTGAGSQASALATNLSTNTHWTGWRTGKGRNLLGVEWVLPNGDILRTGSLAMPHGDYTWGEGPGIDLRGLLRSTLGAMGALGVITRAAIKLHSWPGPSVWPTHGVQPDKESLLPQELFKTFIITFPTLEQCIEAIRELGEAEIGGVVMQPNPFDLIALATKSREEFWAKWHSEYWQGQIHHGHLIFITLWGFASEKQVTYEEQVLMDIVDDIGGELIPESEAEWLKSEVTAAAVRDTHRGRYLRLSKSGTDVISVAESLYDAMRSITVGNELKAEYTPPLGDGELYDMGANQHKFWPADFGRVVSVGISGFGEKSDEGEAVEGNVRRDAIKKHIEDSVLDVGATYEASRIGPYFADIHLLIASIKKAVDPYNIANPTRLVNVKRMEKIQAA